MRLLFDENISHKILPLLPVEFSGSSCVKNEGLIHASDRDIWQFAKKNQFVIVTQDADFYDFSTLYGFPPKIIWIRTGYPRTKDISEILIDSYPELANFEKDNRMGCFEIIKRPERPSIINDIRDLTDLAL